MENLGRWALRYFSGKPRELGFKIILCAKTLVQCSDMPLVDASLGKFGVGRARRVSTLDS